MVSGIDHLDAVDLRQLGLAERALHVEMAVEAVLGGGGVEGLAVVELHARSQLDGDRLAVGRGLVAERELRHDVGLLVDVEQLVAQARRRRCARYRCATATDRARRGRRPARCADGPGQSRCRRPGTRPGLPRCDGRSAACRSPSYFSFTSVTRIRPSGIGLEALQPVGVGDQVVGMEEIDHPAVGQELGGDLLVDLLAGGEVRGGAGLAVQLVDLLVAVAARVQRRAAGLVEHRVAVGIDAAAPVVLVELEVAVLGGLQRRSPPRRRGS